ncbi:hypothetical protein QVD17_02264 [Tagetes erecta]|uniref:Complex 1 LYR protein domain-containing protein n=1 Tax=Tagetes erecta TaxID=13708 RepID=A0AAD8L698_TARER|nr:hypothetical protein QVD17_02264 [Tagetes erecta]
MATVVAPPCRAKILSLFRSLLRSSRQFPDYNIREYTKRRTIDAFHHNKSLSNRSSISTAFTDGKYQLQVAKRQAIVYRMYSPKAKSIMDINYTAHRSVTADHSATTDCVVSTFYQLVGLEANDTPC